MRRMKPWFALLLCLALAGFAAAQAEDAGGAIPGWTEGSRAMASIVDFVSSAADGASPDYVAPEDRIAVFDFDGTLYAERFPTYFDVCLFLHRVLHDETCEMPEEVTAYAAAYEEALQHGGTEPESPRSTAQMVAEAFKDFTVEDYRAYVRDFMGTPTWGFDGMTYGEGWFVPMVSLVEYLAEHGFTVFVSSGSERALVRELMAGTLDRWIPADRVIGSTFSLMATNQGDKAGRSYTYSQEDQVLLEGNLTVKNQKANKVFSIVDEIGKAPIMVFGNSSGDTAMAEYCIQQGGKAWMLLCDDTERDYGDIDVAAEFKADCEARGMETVSMRDDFAVIYENGVMAREDALDDAA